MRMRMNENAEAYHNNLPERILKYLKEERGLTQEIIKEFLIGWNGNAIAIPIYNRKGEVAFFKYRKDPEDVSDSAKYWYDEGAEAELYGWENINERMPFLVLCEGEFDRIILESKGIPAITNTGGANTFKDEWIQCFESIPNLYICYDNDTAGLSNATKLAKILIRAKVICLEKLPQGKKDITDFFLSGNTVEDFTNLIKKAKTLDELDFYFNSLDSSDVIRLQPSQDFIKDTAYFTIPSFEREKDGDVPFKQVYYVITSERKLFKVENISEFYKKYKIFIPQLPLVKNPEIRWPNEFIRDYLFKGYSPSPVKLYNSIKDTLHKYSEMKDDMWYDMLSFWTMGTYFYYIFEAYPYIALEGIKNTGKSTTARIVIRMAFNGILSVNISEASLFRDIESLRCTFAIDEAEVLKDKDKCQLIMAVLNAGYYKGAKVPRQEKSSKGQFYTNYYDIYSPKMIANTQGLEDILESRTIKITMLRAKSNTGINQDSETSENWAHVRHDCYCFALDNFKEIRNIYKTDPEVKVSNNRHNDLWCPILSIAKYVFKDNPSKFKAFKEFALSQINIAQEDSLDDRTNALLRSIRNLSQKDDEIIAYTADIKREMQNYLGKEEIEQIKPSWIGYRLKFFGIKKTGRTSDGYKYLFVKKNIEDLVSRYIDTPG